MADLANWKKIYILLACWSSIHCNILHPKARASISHSYIRGDTLSKSKDSTFTGPSSSSRNCSIYNENVKNSRYRECEKARENAGNTQVGWYHQRKEKHLFCYRKNRSRESFGEGLLTWNLNSFSFHCYCVTCWMSPVFWFLIQYLHISLFPNLFCTVLPSNKTKFTQIITSGTWSARWFALTTLQRRWICS